MMSKRFGRRWWKTRRWWLVLCLLVLNAGCVWKKDYLKMKHNLSERLDKWQRKAASTERALLSLQKEYKTLQGAMATKKKEYASLQKTCSAQGVAFSKLQQQYQQSRGATQQCQRMLKGRGKKLFAMQRELTLKETALKEKATQLETLRAALQKQKAEIKAREERIKASAEQIAQLETQIKRVKTVYQTLQKRLRKMVQAGELNIRLHRGLLILQLREKILFNLNSAVVNTRGKKALTRVTKALSNLKARWQVVGHTDISGPASYNWKLSTRRSLAVLFVMLKAGMPPAKVSVAGQGPYQPIAPNDSKANRALNRRTEIVLVPELGVLFKSIEVKPDKKDS